MCRHSEQELHSRQFHAKNFTHPQEVDILTSNGIITAKIITVRNLTAIGESVEDIDVLCHDLPENSIVEGLLGLNFLQHFDISILFSTGTIEIYPK